MMSRHRSLIVAITIVLVLITGCGKASPTVTLPQPTVTSIPPTATAMLPTNTSVPTAVPPTATPEPAPLPTPADGGGLIAFVSDRDGNGEIYVMNADGSDQRRLTHFRDFDGVPTWSPDGKQIAFYTHLTRNKWAIQVMDADGSNQRPLTDNNACDGAPFWSPDGTRIVFTSAFDCDPDDREIVIMNADGSNQLKLTDNDADGTSADDYLSAWSPDSQQIAFVSDRDGNDEIYIMNADGTNVRRLTFDDGHDRMPAWSPDGTQIAFVSDRDGKADGTSDEIYVMDADGGNPRRLTDNNTDDWFPSWSPDGVQLLFNSRRDGGDLDVYVMTVPDGPDAGGTNVRRLTDAPGEDFNAVWQPLPTDEHVSSGAVDTWVRTYEGDPRWAALDALQTGDGGYLLIGSTNYSHQNTRQEDVYLVKAGPTGEIAWAKAYGGDDFDRGNAVIQADDSGFVILGETKSFGAGDWDMILLKVDADGNELWSKTFGGPVQERATAIQWAADGGYILAGSTKSFGAGDSDLYLVKTDDRGNEVWAQTYGGELDEVGNDVHQTPDGGFLVLAQVTQGERVYVEQSPDVFLLRTDGRGNEIWSQVWEEENVEGGHVLLPTSDGNYIIAGITGPAGSQTDTDFLFLKIDADGNPIWNKPFGDESAVDYGIDVIELSDGGYLLIGMFSGGGRGAIPLIKTDGGGQVLWTRNLIEGRGNKAGIRVFPAPDGGYVIVGITDEHRRAFETVLIKTDSEGKTQTAAPPAATVALSPTDTPEPTSTATPLPPLTGSGSGVIAFTSTRDSNHEVYVMNADGSDPRRLTYYPDAAGIPAWSPDGRRIAFHAHHSDAIWSIHVMNADGSDRQRLTTTETRDANPVWSPDGSQIAFSRDGNIWVMNADGSDQRQLMSDPVFSCCIDWSPDGSHIAFESERDGNSEIYVMNADGSNQRRLTDNDAKDGWPAWSPDSTQIALMSDRDGDWEIYVMDADGGNQRQLTDNDADDSEPAWSPDGTRIAFHSNRDGGTGIDTEIYIMNADGSDQRRITHEAGMDWAPAWRPAMTSSEAEGHVKLEGRRSCHFYHVRL